MSSKLKISPSISTISRISTTLKYSPLFPVSEGSAFKIMPNDFPMGVIVLAIGGITLEGNCPTGVMVLGVRCPGG